MEFTNLKKCMEFLLDEYKTPGLDIIVNKDHEEIFRYTAGFSDLENQRKMQGNEIYDIYSMTKMITCTAALQLVESGKISLDDELSKYLPEFKKMNIRYVNPIIQSKFVTYASKYDKLKFDAQQQITLLENEREKLIEEEYK